MISGINTSGQLSALYPQYNAGRVQPIKKPNAVDSQEALQALYEQSKSQSSVSLSEEMKNAEQLSYSANPYDQNRKMSDITLLAGQNFDIAV